VKEYNYIIIDPRKKDNIIIPKMNFSLLYQPIYIGKGVNKRYLQSKYECKKLVTYKDRLIFKLLYKLKYRIEDIIIKFESDDAILTEKYLINFFGRYPNGPLTNILEGGEGMSSEYMIKNNPMNNISKEEHSLAVQKTWTGIKGLIRKIRLSRKVKGSNNPSAKKYVIIDPNGQKINIVGLKTWCRENNFSVNILRNWIDKGVIRPASKKDHSFSRLSKMKLKDYEIKEIK
jgi:hypothetical protein